MVYALLMMLLFGILAAITWGEWDEIAFDETVFGIPVAVLIWSAIGGFVSVLFRYVFQEEEFQEPTPKWLIIRPLMGMVLGIVTYFAFATGLYLVGDGFDPTQLQESQKLAFLILAFIAGFSDRFAIFILNSVAGKVAPLGSQNVVAAEPSEQVVTDTAAAANPAVAEDDSGDVGDEE